MGENVKENRERMKDKRKMEKSGGKTGVNRRNIGRKIKQGILIGLV
jgi:hypothetical protein